MERKGLTGGGGSTTTTSAAQPAPAHAGRAGREDGQTHCEAPLRNGGRPDAPPGGVDCGTGEDPEGTVSAGADGDEVSSSHGYAGSDVAALGGNDVVVNDGSVDEPDPSPNSHEKSSLPLPDEFDDPPSLPAMSRAAATIPTRSLI